MVEIGCVVPTPLELPVTCVMHVLFPVFFCVPFPFSMETTDLFLNIYISLCPPPPFTATHPLLANTHTCTHSSLTANSLDQISDGQELEGAGGRAGGQASELESERERRPEKENARTRAQERERRIHRQTDRERASEREGRRVSESEIESEIKRQRGGENTRASTREAERERERTRKSASY